MNDITLKEYVALQVEALRLLIKARMDAADLAVARASEQLTIRLEHSNGLIEQMRQQSDDFPRRSEVTALRERIEALERERSKHEGKEISVDFTREAETAALRARIEALERERAKYEGKDHGHQPLQVIGMMIVAAVISAIVAFIASKNLGP